MLRWTRLIIGKDVVCWITCIATVTWDVGAVVNGAAHRLHTKCIDRSSRCRPGFVHYRVRLPSGAPRDTGPRDYKKHRPPGVPEQSEGLSFNVTTLFSGSIQTAEPESMEQDAEHRARLHINGYTSSPYLVRFMTTTAHMSSPRSVDGTTGPQPILPASFLGARVRWGHYENKTQYSEKEGTALATTTAPFARLLSARRRVELSPNLDVMYVDDSYELLHTGSGLLSGTAFDVDAFLRTKSASVANPNEGGKADPAGGDDDEDDEDAIPGTTLGADVVTTVLTGRLPVGNAIGGVVFRLPW